MDITIVSPLGDRFPKATRKDLETRLQAGGYKDSVDQDLADRILERYQELCKRPPIAWYEILDYAIEEFGNELEKEKGGVYESVC